MVCPSPQGGIKMGNLYANFHIHTFEDCEIKIKKLSLEHSTKFSLTFGDNNFGICATYGEFKDIFLNGLAALREFEEEEEADWEQERRKREER